MTAAELLLIRDDGWRYQLVKGEPRQQPLFGAQSARVAANIIVSLGHQLEAQHLGSVYASTAGFIIARNPDTVLASTVTFVRAERVVDTAGFFVGPPDVAFEVVSPGDSYSEVEEKTGEWLRAGTLVVVIVDPRRKTVRIHRATGTTNVEDVLEIDDVIPGWRASLAEIFG